MMDEDDVVAGAGAIFDPVKKQRWDERERSEGS